MAYSDQEEVDKLKEWWKTYGGALVLGIVLGLALLFGNKYWQEYREAQRLAASELYARMLDEVRADETDAARASGETLVEEYDDTPYAGLAALLLARLAVEAEDTATARERLEWAIANASDPPVQHAARLRLGRLHVAAGEYQAALALVQTQAPGFEAEYLELKGDAHVALAQLEAAREAYEQALEHLAPQEPAYGLIRMKLDDLGRAAA